MMKFSSRAAATALCSLLLMSAAFAQTTAPTTAPAAKTTAAPKTVPGEKAAPEKKARTAASLECSKEADTKNIHGKERKKFMSECKKAAADKPK